MLAKNADSVCVSSPGVPRLEVGKEMAAAMGAHATLTYRIYAKLQKLQVEQKLKDPEVPNLLKLADKKRDWCIALTSDERGDCDFRRGFAAPTEQASGERPRLVGHCVWLRPHCSEAGATRSGLPIEDAHRKLAR